MSFRAMGFASLEELNAYLDKNPEQMPGSMIAGFVQNSVVVMMEGDFSMPVEGKTGVPVP